MDMLFGLWSVFSLTAKRLLARKGLALASLVGVIISIILVMSIPLYSDAIYYRIFLGEVYDQPASPGQPVGRMPWV
jgi:hypothetical protein